MMGEKRDILGLTKAELSEVLGALGEPAYRSGQLFSWLHKRGVREFSQMTDISKALRGSLQEAFFIGRLTKADERRSADGTVKYLYTLEDKELIETVVIYSNAGISLCISTQAGCSMGCVFCASAADSLARNLTIPELLGQVYAAADDLEARVDRIVLMGTGEPLDNFCNVMAFYDIITDKDGYGLRNRAVSLSTCGLADKIDLLAGMKTQMTLSVSLHATTDELRDRLMPVNRVYGIDRLMESCLNYQRLTGRRVTFEYAVMAGLNNADEDAMRLAKLARNTGAHVNLIPVNPVRGEAYAASGEDADSFCSKLTALGANATVRRTLGADIEAACGQLRRKGKAADTYHGEGGTL